MGFLAKYNQAKTITFDLFKVDGIDFEPAATFAIGDVKIMQDEGIEANTTNLPTDEGQGYSLVLTAAEMSAARIKIYIVDQDVTKIWLDTSVSVETYGHASAEHEFDFDTPALTAAAVTADIDSSSTQLAAILADTGTDIPATLATIAGYIDTEITTLLTNLSAVGTTATGIQTDLDNATDGLGALKALIDALTTANAAVKAKTDQLTFTVANEVNANTQSINDAAVTGDGNVTPWAGA